MGFISLKYKRPLFLSEIRDHVHGCVEKCINFSLILFLYKEKRKMHQCKLREIKAIHAYIHEVGMLCLIHHRYLTY